MTAKNRNSRRSFLKGSAAAGLTPFFISGTRSSGQLLGANDRIRVCVAGMHGRGKSHLAEFQKLEGVEVSHLVDPDRRLHRDGFTCHTDIRRALDDPSIDVVSIATPNHWHSLMTVWSCQAGKDVYVEKPLSHNVFEGRKAVEAAERYGRIVQHGTQQRSSGGRAREMAAIHSGEYGTLRVAKGFCCKPRWSIGNKPESPTPDWLDWDLWLGPATERPFHGNYVHYNWHWLWDTGNGDTGNQGVHEMDIARWGIAGATMPHRVWSLGGRYAYDDQGETPNTQLAVYDFGGPVLVFETRGLVGKHEGWGRKVANEFHTTEGVIRGNTLHPHGGGKAVRMELPEVAVTPGGPFGSFVHAVRSRKLEDVNASVLEGHYSSALCHLANVSYRLGRDVPFSAQREILSESPEVEESFQQIRGNLEAVGVDLERATLRFGRPLTIDPRTEQCVGDDEANALLRREYRAPFVIEDTV